MNDMDQRIAALVDNGLTVSAAREVAAGDLSAMAALLRTMAHILDEQVRVVDVPAVPTEGA